MHLEAIDSEKGKCMLAIASDMVKQITQIQEQPGVSRVLVLSMNRDEVVSIKKDELMMSVTTRAVIIGFGGKMEMKNVEEEPCAPA